MQFGSDGYCFNVPCTTQPRMAMHCYVAPLYSGDMSHNLHIR